MAGASVLPIGSVLTFYGFIQSLAPVAGERSQNQGVALAGLHEVRAACDRALAAEDLADLEDRLDEMHLQFGDFLLELKRATRSIKPGSRKLGLDEDSLVASLGVTAAREFPRGYPLVRALWEGVQKAPIQPQNLGLSTDSDPDPEAFSDLFYDSEVPLAMREAGAVMIRGVLAAAVIARASELGKKLDPWLALSLAETFSEALSKLFESVVSLLPLLLERGGILKADQNEAFKAHFEEQERYNQYLESSNSYDSQRAGREEPA